MTNRNTRKKQKPKDTFHVIIADMQAIERRLFDFGLYEAARLVNEATNKAGWARTKQIQQWADKGERP